MSESDKGGIPLNGSVRKAVERFLHDLGDHPPTNLYELLLGEVERPLLECIMAHTRGNQTKAAQALGINRGTLRKKLRQYGLEE